jgi:Ankyrin repeats (3 copies)
MAAEQDERLAAAMRSWGSFSLNARNKLEELFGYVLSPQGLYWVQLWWAEDEGLAAVGINVNCQLGPDGRSALHVACCSGKADIVQYLVEVRGANLNLICETDGWTPLMAAAVRNKLECLRVLLELGAEPDLRGDVDGKTALDLAREAGSHECVDLLEQWIADPTVKSALKV